MRHISTKKISDIRKKGEAVRILRPDGAPKLPDPNSVEKSLTILTQYIKQIAENKPVTAELSKSLGEVAATMKGMLTALKNLEYSKSAKTWNVQVVRDGESRIKELNMHSSAVARPVT